MLKFKTSTGSEIPLFELMGATAGKFVSIKNYKSSNGTVRNYKINVYPSYIQVLKRSLKKLDSNEVRDNFHPEIIEEIRESICNSIEKEKSKRRSTYQYLRNGLAVKDGNLYLFGLEVSHQDVLTVPKKEVKHRNWKTAEKSRLRSLLPMSKYKVFKLNENFKSLHLKGKVLK